MAQETQVRAVAYTRYSSDQQREASLADQLRNVTRRAQAEGWSITATYADAAQSGSDANRPQYKAMLAAAARGEFDVLLLDDLSRMTRDSVEQERAIRRLEFSGVRIIATSDGYDSQSKSRKVHRQMKGLMNEQFLDDLRERVHRGQEGRAYKKYWLGGKPHGYKPRPILDASQRDAYGAPAHIGTVLEIDPAQARVVRQIFQRFIAGASAQTIARELNAGKVNSPGSTWKRKTRRANGWMGSAVRVILRNPLYCGLQRWNVSQFVLNPDTGKHLRRARPKAEWVVHQNEALRIVTDAEFEQAHARTRGRNNGDRRLKVGGKPKFLLSGLLVCDTCKAHYVMGDNRAYVCSSHRDGALREFGPGASGHD
jgi:DNA invertase Pin-like site-specific DNA recombinase